jgi:hypothetical protein
MNKRPVNIGGYRFEEGQELESEILINGFNEAVSNGFLELMERKSEGVEPDATQAPQTGDTGKVKVFFHIIFNNELTVIREVEVAPNVPVEFPDIDSREDKIFDGWFKDAEFTKLVNVDKAKSPKKGEIHFYGKYSPKLEDLHETSNSNELTNPNGDAGSAQEKGQVTFPPPIDDEPAKADSENK